MWHVLGSGGQSGGARKAGAGRELCVRLCGFLRVWPGGWVGGGGGVSVGGGRGVRGRVRRSSILFSSWVLWASWRVGVRGVLVVGAERGWGRSQFSTDLKVGSRAVVQEQNELFNFFVAGGSQPAAGHF